MTSKSCSGNRQEAAAEHFTPLYGTRTGWRDNRCCLRERSRGQDSLISPGVQTSRPACICQPAKEVIYPMFPELIIAVTHEQAHTDMAPLPESGTGTIRPSYSAGPAPEDAGELSFEQAGLP